MCTLKLNYVYVGERCDGDLAAFLRWASARPVTVSVLDDLSDPDASPELIRAVLRRLVGAPSEERVDDDPHSLPTLRQRYADGLSVEIKTERLGLRGPYRACPSCPVRARCREGIVALRLTERGRLRICLDRPDLELDLLPLVPAGTAAVAEAMERWMYTVLP